MPSPSPSIVAASAGASRQAYARASSMAETMRGANDLMPRFDAAPSERERIDVDDNAMLASLASDQGYQDLAAEIDALREAEAEADLAPGADQAASADEAAFLRRAEAELSDSETALTVYRSLCRADRAALPEIAPAHQRAAHLSAIRARLARAGRAVALASAAPTLLRC